MSNPTSRTNLEDFGNISDDWNLQEELNRYMDHPRNHPGALADVGHEHDRYQPITFPTDGKRVDVLLRNVESESELHGTEKQISLGADDGYLSIRYALPKNIWRLSTEVCLSPDYYRLLRHGRDGLADFNGKDWRGWSNGSTCVWARIDGDGSTIWDKPFESECGHGLNLRISSFSRDFQIEIGVGTPLDQKLVNDGGLKQMPMHLFCGRTG